MPDRVIDNPIIDSHYRAPVRYFAFDSDGITNQVVEGRRSSSFFVPVSRPRKRGAQQELEFVKFTADQIKRTAVTPGQRISPEHVTRVRTS